MKKSLRNKSRRRQAEFILGYVEIRLVERQRLDRVGVPMEG
ncbi:hypothetical protein [Granulicella sp. L60]|nr:hypothetical protein [Granulicella sp. L60]